MGGGPVARVAMPMCARQAPMYHQSRPFGWHRYCKDHWHGNRVRPNKSQVADTANVLVNVSCRIIQYMTSTGKSSDSVGLVENHPEAGPSHFHCRMSVEPPRRAANYTGCASRLWEVAQRKGRRSCEPQRWVGPGHRATLKDLNRPGHGFKKRP
jgi:hypothetical protein